jgi:hypothetical protein
MTVSAEQTLARLQGALERLAAPPDEQIEALDALGVAPSADELALEFDDVWPSAQRIVKSDALASISMLDAFLESMSSPDHEHLWTFAALRGDPHWERARLLAQQALSTLRRSMPSGQRQR